MAKEHGEDGATPQHRPLPSVDVALLPHELRATRARNAALAGTAAVVLIALGAFAYLRSGDMLSEDSEPAASDDPWPSELAHGAAPDVAPDVAAPRPDTEAVAADAVDVAPQAQQVETALPDEAPDTAAVPAVAALPSLEGELNAALGDATATGEPTRITRPFGQARGFRDALRGSGASPEEADALVSALEKLVDFRRCRPEHQLTFARDAQGRLTEFEYKASITDLYRATRRTDGSFKGERAEVPIERRRIARGGYVAGSLGGALDGLGLGRSLASSFVAAFEGKIDFKKHTRKGDSFKLIVDEEYVDGTFLRYGEVYALEYSGERVGHERAFWFEAAGKAGKGDYYAENGRAIHGGWLRTPLRYDHISSVFDPRRKHPILKRIVPHNGIDYAAASGTSVWAAADGTVTFAGVRGANGNLIAIRHAGGYETFYAHLLRISRGIKKGVVVEQRQPIGAVGTTGRSTGPHLHFALKRRGRFINPEKQLNGPGKPLPSSQMPSFKRAVSALKRELAAITLAAAPSGQDGDDGEGQPGEVFVDEEPLDL